MNTILPYFRLDAGPLWQLLPVDRPADFDRNTDVLAAALRKKLDRDVGFYDWPEKLLPKDFEAIESLAKTLRGQYQGVVIFGIGGSYLGPAAIVDALATPSPEFPILWLSNSDSPEIRRIEAAIQGKRFAAIVISKSGGTVETLSAFFHLSRHFDPKGIVVITDPQTGELRRLATAMNWSALAVPPSVGGRFSVLTSVGLLPTALAGLSPRNLIAGALKMRQALEATESHNNPAFQLARAYHLWDRGFEKHIQYLMPYERRLKLFADWWVQLFGESLGKRTHADSTKSVGFTPVSALGTSDQHSILQLLKEGPSDKLVGFLSVSTKDNPVAIRKPDFEVKGYDYLFNHTFDEVSHFACLATQQSLGNSAMPTYRLEFQRLEEATLGSLFFFFETVCAYAGELYGVDAFNQPGVEEAKRLLKQSLI